MRQWLNGLSLVSQRPIQARVQARTPHMNGEVQSGCTRAWTGRRMTHVFRVHAGGSVPKALRVSSKKSDDFRIFLTSACRTASIK